MGGREEREKKESQWWGRQSASKGEKKLAQPHALEIVLSDFHIHVDGPEVPSFGMRIDDTLEQRLAPLRIA